MNTVLTFNGIDYGIIAIILLSVLISLIRGFVKEAISLVTWIAAVWIAIQFSSLLAEYLQAYIHNPTLRLGASAGILFIAVLILGAMFNFLMGQLVRKTGLSGTDRVIGVTFGFARGILVIAVLLLGTSLTVFSKSEHWQNSMLIPHFQPMVSWLQEFLPKNLVNTLQGEEEGKEQQKTP